MTITAQMVKELRERTSAGMMECKKALTETNGDMEAAVQLLRTSGAANRTITESDWINSGLNRVLSW